MRRALPPRLMTWLERREAGSQQYSNSIALGVEWLRRTAAAEAARASAAAAAPSRFLTARGWTWCA